MKKQMIITFVSAALACASAATVSGTITDDMCEKADHKDMKMGSDAKCVEECIKGMKGKYVLYDGKQAWALSDQTAPAKFAAKKVTVTGTVDQAAKTIKVDKIEAAK